MPTSYVRRHSEPPLPRVATARAIALVPGRPSRCADEPRLPRVATAGAISLVPGRLSRRGDEPPLPRVATAGAKTLSPAVQGADSGSGPASDCRVCLEPLRGGEGVVAAHACGHVLPFRAPTLASAQQAIVRCASSPYAVAETSQLRTRAGTPLPA